MRYLLGIILLLASCIALDAQPAADLDDALRVHIGLVARGARDSIVLRWAPSKAAVWLAGRNAGYRIERATLDAGGRPGRFAPLLDSAVKPWPYELWLAYADSHPPKEGDTADYPAVAYTLLNQFGEDAPARDDYSADDAKGIAERKSELEMRFGFAMVAADRSIAAAEGMGLRFTDRTISPGVAYAYRVYLAGAAGDYRVDTGSVTVKAESAKSAGHQALAIDGGEGKILLRWRANRYYGSYSVDRSENNGATFIRLNAVPMVTLRPTLPTENDEEIFLDTTARERKVYLYRVYGATPFAEEEIVGEGRGTTRDVTAPAKPFLPNPEHVAARRVMVRWQAGEPMAPDLAGFRVLRGGTDSGPFTRISPPLLPSSSREYADSTFRDDGANYYLIEALDTAGNTSRSNPAYVALIDSTPPERPRWIDGRMDSSGVVTLRLHANGERDLMGYRLLRANAPDHEFSPIIDAFGAKDAGSLADTIYHDTVAVRTLTRYVYYRAVALDRNYNESELSAVLAIPRPDVVPPVSPVITDVHVTDSSVELRYVPSSSEDVAYHAVLRRAQGSERWDSVARAANLDTFFLDRAVKRNVTYEYAMLAIDSSGLRSEQSAAVVARPYDPGVRPVVSDLAAAYDAAKGTVTLTWSYPRADEEYWFIVYRAGADGMLRSYARVASTARTFVDTQPEPKGTTMSYAVRVVARIGAQSALSEKVGVRVGE
jgi:hypothetical protein